MVLLCCVFVLCANFRNGAYCLDFTCTLCCHFHPLLLVPRQRPERPKLFHCKISVTLYLNFSDSFLSFSPLFICFYSGFTKALEKGAFVFFGLMKDKNKLQKCGKHRRLFE